MMRSARLLLDPPASGSLNMAVDQALLESVGGTGEMVLRFYRWEEPTLSLGYFQPLSARNSHSASLDCPVVRRSTGGGAILHDREITYSLCIPSWNRWAKSHEQLYWTVHGCIIDALSAMGIEAKIYLSANDGPPDLEQPVSEKKTGLEQSQQSQTFLCFQRRSKGDIVLGTEKICGSAQRRSQNSILQHGSLIFSRSKRAPELPGIDDLSRSGSIDQEWYLQRLIRRMEEIFSVELVPSKLSDEENSDVWEIEPFFRSSEWLNKRKRTRN